ncbi:MAG TPA: NAD(+) synthase [Bacteroidetes bacterium]|nr:NAD(+) synthase [Bacteroidota bacterium]
MKYIKVAGACVNQTPLDWEGNIQRLIGAVREARSQGASILCLPELAICGYGCEDTFFSDYVLKRSLQGLRRLADECQDIVVSVGLPMEMENCLYNVSALIQNRRILGFAAKQELAGDGVYYEPRWFKSWPDNLVRSYRLDGEAYPFGDLIFEVDDVRIAFEICEDAWNGVRPAQDHYLNNVDIILNPSASHFAFGKSRVREKLVTETTRGYFCAYVYSNLLGNESGRLIFDGEVLIAQGGKLLARNTRFSFRDFQVTSAVLDVQAIRRQKKKSFNFEPNYPDNLIAGIGDMPEAADPGFFDRQEVPNFLSKEEEFYQAETLGLFDYMRKSYSRGFVVSLSGGADSSCCGVLIAETFRRALAELGEAVLQEKLHYMELGDTATLVQRMLTCVYQGTDNSSEDTLESARELALDLGADFHHWNVQELYHQYTGMVAESLDRALTWEEDDLALQNIQARLRAPGVWMMANIRGALLVTTSNRSEAAVGYATMDGDTAGGIAPLGGIDKVFLLHWLRWAETELKIKGLGFVNNLQPSAELRPLTNEQTDEGDLMPYAILDQIERAAIRDYKSPLEVFKTMRGIREDKVLKGYIRKFFTLWARNQWKRERYAPSFHLDDANLDPKTWCRFPILSGSYREDLEEMDVYK